MRITLSPAKLTPSSSLITHFPVKTLVGKLAYNVVGSIDRDPPFCSFALFSTASLTPFINNPASSSDSIFMIPSNSSFENIKLSYLT